MRNFRTLLLFPLLLTVISAHADLVINHDEGNTNIGKFDLKIVSISGKVCFEQKNISEFIPQIIVKKEALENCANDESYRVYGIIRGWGYGYKVYYSNRFVQKDDACDIKHEKEGYFSSKLNVTCE